MRISISLIGLLLIIFASGCLGLKPLKPGKASLGPGSPEFTQSENPQAPSEASHESSTQTQRSFPPGTTVTETTKETGKDGVERISGLRVYQVPSAFDELEKRLDKKTVSIGAAQKDLSREVAAKLKAMQPAIWIGLALILGSLFLFWKGWITPGLIAAGGGIGLMLFANLIASHTVLLLVLALIGLAIYIVFWSYNKGSLDRILPDALDKNPPKSAIDGGLSKPVDKT